MTTINITNERFLKPGTIVEIGPPENSFRGTVFKSILTMYCDQSCFIEYAVEWWDDKVLHRDFFHFNDLTVIEEE